jgi:hypothetical protein
VGPVWGRGEAIFPQASTTVSVLLVKDDFVLMTAEATKTPPTQLSIVWPNSDHKPY